MLNINAQLVLGSLDENGLFDPHDFSKLDNTNLKLKKFMEDSEKEGSFE